MELGLEIPFSRWLTAIGLLTESELQAAEARHRATGERLTDAIVHLGYMSGDEMAGALARRLELPYLRRDDFPSAPPFLKNLSPHYMRQYRFCPLILEHDILTIACADPLDPVVLDELRPALELTIRLAVVSEPADPGGDRALLWPRARPRCKQPSRPSVRTTMISGRMGRTSTRFGTGRLMLRWSAWLTGLSRTRRHPTLPISTSSRRAMLMRVRYRIDGRLYKSLEVPLNLLGRHQPHQDHGRARHQRAPPAAGRPRHVLLHGREVDLRVQHLPRPSRREDGDSRARSRGPSRSTCATWALPKTCSRRMRAAHPASRTASSWSPGPPAAANRRRSTPRSTNHLDGEQHLHRRRPDRVPAGAASTSSRCNRKIGLTFAAGLCAHLCGRTRT